MKFSIDGSELQSDLNHFNRLLALGGGIVYLVWWFAVELLLPGSYNPFLSRLIIVLYCFAIALFKPFNKWLPSCLWLVTLHYFYLFYRNQSDINWVVGAYITIIAVCACFQTRILLLTYSCFVLILSLILVFFDRPLLQTTFLPGVLTILSFAHFGLRGRLKLMLQSQESSHWFQSIFDAVFEGVAIHHEGLIVDANEAFAKIFGYQRKEVVGKRVIEFVNPESRALVMEKIQTMSEIPYETTGIKKDGSVILIEIRGKQHSLRGKSFRIAAVVDITERKKSEKSRMLYEASQESLRMRDEFISIASHELKTPLTSLKLQMQVASRNLLQGKLMESGPEKMKAFLGTADRQINRLIKLVEEMLDVSSISSGRVNINKENFDLVQLIREVLESFSSIIQQSACKIEIESPEHAFINADRFRIEQVVINLLSNAVKYGAGLPIFIQVQPGTQETKLIFKDQGIGIAPHDQKRIFQRFERAIPSDNISGLGLGLYICKYIMDAHQGSIEVESQLGSGSRFTVKFPKN